jgi:hypothetical protein
MPWWMLRRLGTLGEYIRRNMCQTDVLVVRRLINHSCDPNCTAKIITITGQKKIVIYAKWIFSLVMKLRTTITSQLRTKRCAQLVSPLVIY